MKVLKKQGLTLFLIAALVVTLTLGIVFALPARNTANADEGVSEEPAEEVIDYGEPVHVSTEQALKDAVKNAGTTPKKIILDGNIEMNSITSKENKKFYELTVNRDQVIEIDLAGHILSTAPMSAKTKPVIDNYGTLSIVDSSNNYSGGVVSNGYIEDKSNGYYWDASNNVIQNYGALTVDANLSMNLPSAASWGTDGSKSKYVGGGTNVQSNISKIYLIYNIFVAPSPKDDLWQKHIYPTSLTINGGNFDLAFSNYYSGTVNDTHMPPMEHFFYIGSTDLTINGGTFRNTATKSDNSPFLPYNQGGFLADVRAVTSVGDYASYLKDVLHMDIKITGGDFGDKNLLNGDNAFVYVDEFKQKRDGDEYEISISGGKFPMDLSVYTDAEHMMKANDDGTYSVVIVDEDYINEYAVAKLMLDDGEDTLSGYYGSFEGAWGAAQTLAQMGQSVILTLLKDAEYPTLVFERVPKDIRITFDLNGHELKVVQEGKENGSYHITVTGVGGDSVGIRTFVVRDTSEKQNGKLNLVYLNDTKGGGFSISKELKFVLESGTITRTGGGFYEEPNGQVFNSTSERNKAIFQLTSEAISYQEGDLITIRGGNILSELEGDDYGYLASTPDCKSEDYSDYLDGYDLKNYTNYLTLDFADYLDTLDKGCRFSWDLSSILPEGYKCAEDTKTHIFYVSCIGADKYLVGEESFTTLSAAIQKANEEGAEKTILMIAPDEVAEAVELDGITLDLNIYQQFTLKVESGITLKGGAKIVNGTISGNITVDGSASFENFELQGNLIVKSTAKLEITEGIYNGTVTVEGDANLSISGGSFRGREVGEIEKHTPQYYGMFKLVTEEFADDTLYPVRIAPNGNVRNWYTETFVASNYTINSADDWNNFALIVSSGANNFDKQTIKLGQSIDFSKSTQGIALYGATATEPNFLPAGTNAYRFAGSFNGQGNTMSGIYAQEINVGLFGATAYHHTVRVMNITVENSTFISGHGRFDTFNTGATPAAGAIVGEGHLDGGTGDTPWSGRITLSGVTIGHEAEGQYFTGGVVGHSWGDVYLDGLTIKNKTTLQHAWKMGGVVGYLEGSFYIKKADIEQGKEPDGSDNGLILEGNGKGYVGALVGHANGSSNTIEDCTILEHKDSLIGTTYAGGQDGTITIKGSDTNLDIYRVVGEGLAAGEERRNPVDIQITGEITEAGVSNGSIKTHEAEEYLTFSDGEGKPITPETNSDGGYDVQSTLRITVIIYDIQIGTITYGPGESQATSFKLKTADGEEMSTPEGLTLTVTWKASSVGQTVVLITALTLGGEDAGNYTLALAGQPAFLEATVVPATLYASVDENGNWSFTGFVNGDDESVLSGTPELTRDGKVIGITSENYNIVYVGELLDSAGKTDLTALWVVLAVVGAAAVVGTGLYFGTRRKKQ